MSDKVERYEQVAASSVVTGMYLPAHDKVFDLAESIARKAAALHAYITEVRDEEQATSAVSELLYNLSKGV